MVGGALLGRNLGGRSVGLTAQFRKVFGHLGAIQGLVGSLVARSAIHFGNVTRFALAMCWESFCQRLHVRQVQITCHANAIPSCDTLGGIALPIAKRLGVVAISTVPTQGSRHVGHQAIRPLGLFDGLHIASWQGGGGTNTDIFFA